MTVPYSKLRLNSLHSNEITGSKIDLDGEFKMTAIGGQGANTKISLNPWALRAGGASAIIQAVDRNFSSDIVISTAPLGDATSIARKRFTFNDVGLAVRTDQLPAEALDVYGNARVRGELHADNVKLDTIRYANINAPVKHFFFHWDPDLGWFNLSLFFFANNLPNDTRCILSLNVIQYHTGTGDPAKLGYLNDSTGTIKYAMEWNVDKTNGEWFLLHHNPPGPYFVRIYIICSTTVLD